MNHGMQRISTRVCALLWSGHRIRRLLPRLPRVGNHIFWLLSFGIELIPPGSRREGCPSHLIRRRGYAEHHHRLLHDYASCKPRAIALGDRQWYKANRTPPVMLCQTSPGSEIDIW